MWKKGKDGVTMATQTDDGGKRGCGATKCMH